MKLLVCERTNLAGLALPNDRSLILAPGFNVAIQAVIREVDLAAHKPFRPGAIPFENALPLFEPVEFAGNPRPELVGLVDGFSIEMLVFLERLDVSLLAEFRRRLELAQLIQSGIDVRAVGIDGGFIGNSLIGHDKNLDCSSCRSPAPDRRRLFYTARRGKWPPTMIVPGSRAATGSTIHFTLRLATRSCVQG